MKLGTPRWWYVRDGAPAPVIRALLRLKEHAEKRRAWDGLTGLFRRRPAAEAPLTETAP